MWKQQAKRKGLVDKPRKKRPRTKKRVAEDRPAASESLSASECPPTNEGPVAKPDLLTAEVRREVWTRDQARCQWPLESGGVCGSTWRLEYDHVLPRAWGGTSTADNVRLLCRAHNDLAARHAFGDAWMNQFTGNGTQDGGSSTG